MPTVINRRRHTRSQDQIVGATQRAGVAPTVRGIARDRLLAKAMRQAADSTEALHTLIEARDSADPSTAEIANLLLGNREFVGAMHDHLAKILAKLKAAQADQEQSAQPAAAAPAKNSDPTSPVMPRATDSAFLRPGSYTKARLLQDLATQNATAETLARREGMDAASARVSRTPLVPPWDSPVWSNEARQYFLTRAAGDGFAAQHIQGNVPAIESYFAAE